MLNLATAPAPVQPAPPNGFNLETPYDPGVGTATALVYKSTDVYPEVQSWVPAPFPSLSASAAVVDVHAYNYSNGGVRVCALDPARHTIVVGGGVATEACQGQSYINPSPTGVDPSIHTYRANLNFDTSAGNVGKVYFGIAVAPGNEVALGTVYRGYLEPIKSLFGR